MFPILTCVRLGAVFRTPQRDTVVAALMAWGTGGGCLARRSDHTDRSRQRGFTGGPANPIIDLGGGGPFPSRPPAPPAAPAGAHVAPLHHFRTPTPAPAALRARDLKLSVLRVS